MPRTIARETSVRNRVAEVGKGASNVVVMDATPGTLRARILPVPELDAAARAQMWSLFSRYYSDAPEDAFHRDLDAKQHVIVLRGVGGAVAGFSTLETWVQEVEGRRVAIIYSGDTIVDERYWGQTVLQRAFFRYIVRGKVLHPFLPVYWFLISKGYKTYLLLTRNFPVHWPRHDRPTPPFETALLDALGRRKFAARWDADKGTLRHDEGTGKLKPQVAPIDAELLAKNPDARFFVERNPGHNEGDELCCLGLIDPAMWLSYVAKLARRGLR